MPRHSRSRPGSKPGVSTNVTIGRFDVSHHATKRAAFVAEKRAEYEQDVDILRLASDLVLDVIIEPQELRAELVRRYAVLVGKSRARVDKRHGVPPT